MLASLGRYHKSGKSGKPCARRSVSSAIRAVETPVFVYLRGSCNHVT